MKKLLILLLLVSLQANSASIMRYTQKQKDFTYNLYKKNILQVIGYLKWYNEEYCGCQPKFSPNIKR